MGIGDEIMVTGEIKRRAGDSMRRFAIKDARKGGIHRWHEIWQYNPRIAAPGQQYDDVYFNHGGARPYIAEKTIRRWLWQEYTPEPGEIFLTPAEKDLASHARGRVVFKLGIKDGASPNKLWNIAGWQSLIAKHPQVPWLQIGPPGEEASGLRGVPFLPTRSFRDACGVLSGARAAVLLEGGLHHAAAALNVPAVVIFGGYISPRSTGYDLHRNLFPEDRDYPLGCGMRSLCMHCQKAMEKISPQDVYKELEAIL